MAKSDWLDTNTATEQLGITPHQLRYLRSQGLFKIGKHYRVISSPNAARPTYQWRIEPCSAALEIPPEKR